MSKPLLAAPLILLFAAAAAAEDGHAAWLRYARLDPAAASRMARLVPPTLVVLGEGPCVRRAGEEVRRALGGMLGRETALAAAVPAGGAIVLGTLEQLRASAPRLAPGGRLGADGFRITAARSGAGGSIVIAGDSDRGVLYGAFAFLRAVSLGELTPRFDRTEAPAAPIRWINHWDNVDGTIERGYGGRSIFWEGGRLREDLTAVDDYGRLLASLGINGASINNVNANPIFLSAAMLPQIARVADTLRPWGVQVALAVDFASPRTVGKLDTYDPVDPQVIAWWKATVDRLYAAVPDLGGIVLKADSEGRVGPSAYKRTHADAANVIARALKPHGGVFFYRGFVYDHKMDWRNLKNDRARAAYDNFKSLDGQFDDNVVIQIKHGPIDFQVREPASPLFGALERTNQAIELQITQEYFGQGRHTVFLVPMWKEALDFDMQARGPGTPVKTIVSGRTFGRPVGGFAGVSNAGRDANWFGNHLSQANLYGFGRLAWDPNLTAARIADEWTRLTFGHDSRVVRTVNDIQLGSWRVYENYTGPLGLQTLTDIVGNHYGVSVEASERNGWGQWHRADEKGVGMDRTVATGTGYIGQYSPSVARRYESLATVPDELVLFLHHVPYTHTLKSGKTVIQHIYDSHYDGADSVARWVVAWNALRGRLDHERFVAIRRQLEYQAGQAVVWRDAVTRWFLRMSGIRDVARRVAEYPGRFEAESASLDGYAPVVVTPWEAASGHGAVECRRERCGATFGPVAASGRYDVVVQYFDVNTGTARYRARAGVRLLAEWTADDRLPTRRLDGSSSYRRLIPDVVLRAGDALTIEGLPAGEETAALDYVELRPKSRARSK